MRKVLTDTLLRSLQARGSGRVELADAKCAGLAIRVAETGGRSWSFRFRDPRSGRVTRATLGTYPDLSLVAAREKATDMRRAVARGRNPVDEKRGERREAQEKMISALADRYLQKHARRFKKSHAADERNLRLHVLPKWANRRFDEIRRADVIELCEGMISAGTPTNANRVQALISKMFAFAVDESSLEANPCHRLAKRAAESRGKRTLSDEELRLFVAGCSKPPVSKAVGLALHLALLTAVRAGEIAGMRHDELRDLDRETARWELPGDRTKNGMPHVVPLSADAVALVREACSRTPQASVFVFPSPAIKDAPITAHALAVAMARIAKSLNATAPGAATWKAKPPSPHDLRRTAATRMAALGVPAEDVAACLNHKRRDVTGVHYDQYDRLREKQRAFKLWANHLASLLEHRAPEQLNVVPLRQVV
jgi:integrase